MSKALVISGGGAKGAYGVGVLDYFQNHGNNGLPAFDVFVGTSSGSLIIPFVALGRIPDLVRIFTTTEDEDVMEQRNLRGITKKVSLFDTTPLEQLIHRELSDRECTSLIASTTQRLHFLTGCLQTKKLTVFTTSDTLTSTVYDVIRINTPKEFKDAMLASANQPIIMPPIQVNGARTTANRTHQYVDGGLVEYVGTEIAMNSDCQDILTIILSSDIKTTADKPYKELIEIAQATLSAFTNDVGANDERIPKILNDGLTFISKIKASLEDSGVAASIIEEALTSFQSEHFKRAKPHNIQIIRPSKELFSGIEALKFDPANMKEMLKLGREDAKEYLQKVFAPGENIIA